MGKAVQVSLLAFVAFSLTQAQTRPNAALIIGGYQTDDQGTILTDGVELFGCEHGKSIQVKPYPNQIGFAGATYTDEHGVVVCGGYTCLNYVCSNGGDTACHTFQPDEWTPFEPMKLGRFDFNLGYWPNKNDTMDPNARNLITFGYTMESEIYNSKGSGTWENYFVTDTRTLSQDCVVFNEDDGFFYHIMDEVTQIDPANGVTRTLGEVPDSLKDPGHCAIMKFSGQTGIFTKYGFWYNINLRKWEQKHEAPYHPWAAMSNTMYTWRGLPTIFGNPICAIDGTCVNQRVVQYDPKQDDWITIGTTDHNRLYFDVVEVPAEYCDNYAEPDGKWNWHTGNMRIDKMQWEPFNQLPPPKKSPKVADTKRHARQSSNRPNAAVIIGGYTIYSEDPRPTDVVELFGCEDAETDTISLLPFPRETYLGAAEYMWDAQKGHQLLYCGGYTCYDDVCGLDDHCYVYDPQTGKWDDGNQFPRLMQPRYSHMMDMLPNWNTSDPNDMGLITYGYHYDSEIFNWTSMQWENYYEVDQKFFSTDCVVYNEEDNSLYTIMNDIVKVDMSTAQKTVLAEAPPELRRPGQCSLIYKDGIPGILTKYGFVYNLYSRMWEVTHEPPYHPAATLPNAIWPLNGKATVFGNPVCDIDGDCKWIRVIDYNAKKDQWNNLGTLALTRRYETVVEVPQEFCDLALARQ